METLEMQMEQCRSYQIQLRDQLLGLASQLTAEKLVEESALRGVLEQLLKVRDQQTACCSAYRLLFPGEEVPGDLTVMAEHYRAYTVEQQRRQALAAARAIEQRFAQIRSKKDDVLPFLQDLSDQLHTIGEQAQDADTYLADTQPYADFLEAITVSDLTERVNLAVGLRESRFLNSDLLVSLVFGDLSIEAEPEPPSDLPDEPDEPEKTHLTAEEIDRRIEQLQREIDAIVVPDPSDYFLESEDDEEETDGEFTEDTEDSGEYDDDFSETSEGSDDNFPEDIVDIEDIDDAFRKEEAVSDEAGELPAEPAEDTPAEPEVPSFPEPAAEEDAAPAGESEEAPAGESEEASADEPEEAPADEPEEAPADEPEDEPLYEFPCYTRNQYAMPVVETGDEKTPVTSKTYRKDMEKFKRGANFCMMQLVTFRCLNNQTLCSLPKLSSADFTPSLEFLLSKGYARRITVEGFPPFFNTSIKGEHAYFKYDDVGKKMPSNLKDGVYDLEFNGEEQINAALSRIAMNAMYTSYLKLWANKKSPSLLPVLTYTFFANAFGVLKNILGHSVGIWLHSVCLAQPENSAEYVSETAEKLKKMNAPVRFAAFACDTLEECRTFRKFWTKQGVLDENTVCFFYCLAEQRYYHDDQPAEEADFTHALRKLLNPDLPDLNKAEETSETPEETPEAPEETSEVPEETPEAPEETSEAPEETSDEPEEAPEKPEETSETPEETSEAPEETSEAPEETPDEPQEAPEKPEYSVVEPLYFDVEREPFIQKIYEFLTDGKFYIAAAYAQAAAKSDPTLRSFCRELAYACNDPAEGCRYSAAEIINYFSEEPTEFLELTEYLRLCAAMRSLFTNDLQHDYQFRMLYDMIHSNPAAMSSEPLSKLLYELKAFKDISGHCIDAAADYRIRQHLEYDRMIAMLSANAKQDYQERILSPVKEKASFKRYVEMQKEIFSRANDLSSCLDFVANDNRDSFNLDYIRDFMYTNDFIEENGEIRSINLRTDGISDYIEYYWNVVGDRQGEKHKSTKLTGALWTKSLNMLRRLLSEIADWYYYVTASGAQSSEALRYPREKQNIHALIREAEQVCRETMNAGTTEPWVLAGNACLAAVLAEFDARLSGSYTENGNRYFYVPFLQYGEVMLNDSFQPELQQVLARIDGFSPMQRIVNHAALPERPYAERIAEIFGRHDGDPLAAEDYGCARLLREYLITGKGETWDDDTNNIEGNAQDALHQMKTIHSNFIGSLELAQSYGQITIDRKEHLLALVDMQFHLAVEETQNFGFFRRMLRCCEENIRTTARSREEDLEAILHSLTHELHDDDEQALNLLAKAKELMKQQNYTVVEDIIRRIQTKDFSGEVFNYPTEDNLAAFIDEYDINYEKVRRNTIPLSRILTQSGKPWKDVKGMNKLIENYPQDPISAAQIREFLDGLGFSVESVSKTHKLYCFDVRLAKPASRRKESYSHPISPFGSFAEQNSFQVQNLFGAFDCNRLLDTFRAVGTASHMLVTLNIALSLAERRELARRIKAELPEKTFIVIDRVTAFFLAKHYMKTSVNRVLMEITLPFGWFQPYSLKAATPIPPEMFMGRKEMLLDIESPKGANIVCGGRQLGKSALLRMAKNNIDFDEKHNRAAYVDIKGKNYTEAAHCVSLELIDTGILDPACECSDWEQLSRYIRLRLTSDQPERIPYFLLLIDEADAFLESCKEVEYAPLQYLEKVQTYLPEGRFKFVIAGLRNLVQFEHKLAMADNNPLPHMSSRTIRPFTAGEAMELLIQPLHYLGIRFPKDKQYLISLILASTNYFPGLIHYYCACLLDAMRKGDYAGYSPALTPPYELTEAHIKKVLADKSFNKEIKEKFDITLGLDTDNYYDIIAKLIAYCYYTEMTAEGYTADRIFALAEEYSITKLTTLGLDKLRVLMDELCDLNILRKNPATESYLFARYNFIQLLGTLDEIENDILNMAEEEN